MKATQTRKQQRNLVHTVALGPGEAADAAALDRRTWLTEPGAVPARRVLALAVAWPVVYAIGLALEPAAADADAAPGWAAVLGTVFMSAALVAVVGFVRRTRLGMLGSFVAAGSLLALAIACPTSGHHVDIGAWWAVQLAGASGLGVASLAGLRR